MIIEQDLFVILSQISDDSCVLMLQQDIYKIGLPKIVKVYPSEFTISLPKSSITVATGHKDSLLLLSHEKFNTPIDIKVWPYRRGEHNSSGWTTWHYRITNFK